MQGQAPPRAAETRAGCVLAAALVALALLASSVTGTASASVGTDGTRPVPGSAATPGVVVRLHPAPIWRPDAAAAPLPSAVPDVTYHVPILMYHRVVPAREAGNSMPSLVVEPSRFRAQLEALRRAGWRSITLEQLARDMRSGVRIPPRTFSITFDDGWSDGYAYVRPVLGDLGYHATFFVIASRIGWSGFLSAAQIRELVREGDEIGNHTMNHAALSTLPYEAAVREIEDASTALERILGRRPVSLSYPKSGVAPYVVDAAGACRGLDIAVTTRPWGRESWRDRFAMPRIDVRQATEPEALLAELEPAR